MANVVDAADLEMVRQITEYLESAPQSNANIQTPINNAVSLRTDCGNELKLI
jgi:hypothetical protein